MNREQLRYQVETGEFQRRSVFHREPSSLQCCLSYCSAADTHTHTHVKMTIKDMSSYCRLSVQCHSVVVVVV